MSELGSESGGKQVLIGHKCSRWFDKWQILIDCEGNAGFNLEHAPYDGHTFVSMFNRMDSLRNPPHEENSISAKSNSAKFESSNVSRLDPGPLSNSVRQSLEKGFQFLAEKESSLQLAPLAVSWGSNAIKKLNSSPDAFMQLSFQLAWSQSSPNSNLVPSIYESAQIKRFLGGRTETIRPLTFESSDLVKQWPRVVANQDSAKLRNLFDSAANAHVSRVRQAKSGSGVDRHLFALKWLAKHRQQRLPNFEFPEFFRDSALDRYMDIDLSTSNSGAPSFHMFAFGPVVPSGLGVGYQTFPDSLSVCTTSYGDAAHTFSRNLSSVMHTLQSELGKTATTKRKQ